MSLPSLLFVGQLASTLPLVGLIWTIQVVHYPLFDAVRDDMFVRFHQAHSTRITLIVMPLMVVELAAATAGVVLFDPASRALGHLATWVGFVAVVVIWAATFLLSVPMHGRLSAGFDLSAHRRLVWTNWVRTAAWTVRGVVLVVAVARMLP
ncbi:hypothetical protein BH11MYX1_BH11MYX1_21240 [soil metagenome]